MADKKHKPSENLNVPEDIPQEFYRGHDGLSGDEGSGSWWSDPDAMSSDLSPEQQESITKQRKKAPSASKSTTTHGGS